MAPEQQVIDAFKQYHGQGLFTHAAAAFGSLLDTKPVFIHNHLPAGRDLFDLASLTKALVTTPLIFRQTQKVGFQGSGQTEPLNPPSLGDCVETWLGSVKSADLDSRLRHMTVKSLLNHESGLPAWRNFWVCHLGVESPEVLRDPVLRERRLVAGLNRAATALPAAAVDGDVYQEVYSDVGFLLLGLVLERRNVSDLSVQFKSMCREDLGLQGSQTDMGYGPSFSKADMDRRAVSTGYCHLRGVDLCGDVHDENCAALGGIAAHAGLFGSIESVALYLHRLYASGLGKAMIGNISKARCDAGVEVSGDEAVRQSLLGWRQGLSTSAQVFRNGRAIGHLGFTGTAFWIDPERAEYAILLTNRVCSGRLNPEIGAFRRKVFAAMNSLRSR